ncbi:MAG: phosphopentomutase [Actinomycetota bacterium]
MSEPLVPRVLLLVCDGLGVGGAPDATEYGDEGSNSLGNAAAAAGGITAPNLGALGLGMTTAVQGVAPQALRGSAHGVVSEASAGKDSATGHWEMAGVVLERPFPTYPDGFPPGVIAAFQEAIGREVLGNRAASGTEILDELGEEHLRTGKPIVYTSGDSVFQIACHDRVARPAILYRWCRIARRMLDGEHNVTRVIARPFTGEPGGFVRTAGRRDYSVVPPGPTLLDRCTDAGVAVYGVGKIRDIFPGPGITEGRYAGSDDEGITVSAEYLSRAGPCLVFSNLVDLDTKFGHRNDPDGYARCIENLDTHLPSLLEVLDGGVMFLTGDHGCDPTTAATDHSRERVPLLVAGLEGGPVDLGVRQTFADIGATIAYLLGVAWDLEGTSFARELGFAGEGG